jgi:hypothetical protein
MLKARRAEFVEDYRQLILEAQKDSDEAKEERHS